MARKTRYDYRLPGSFERIEEAALALADADSEDDVEWRRRRERLRAAVVAYHFSFPTKHRGPRPEQPALPFKRTRPAT